MRHIKVNRRRADGSNCMTPQGVMDRTQFEEEVRSGMDRMEAQ